MKRLLTSRLTLATAVLLGLCTGSEAQSLGNIEGKAWIGQPFAATLPANFADDDACLHADVSYGDERLGSQRVHTSIEGSGDARVVRVQADPPIDEPVVTVAVRVGCRNTMTRSYTLLPDYPTATMLADVAPPATNVRVPRRGVTTAALSTRAAGASPSRPLALRPAVDRPPRASHAVLKVRQPVQHGARLRLEPWDMDVQPATLLRVSATISPPQESARATAALLWQALNASPEQLLRSAATLQQLQGQLAQLRQAAGETHNEVVALRRELDTIQPGVAAQNVRLLALLLALGAGTAAFLWYRSTREGVPGEWSGQPFEPAVAGPQPQAAPAAAPLAPPVPVQQPMQRRAMDDALAEAPAKAAAMPVRLATQTPQPSAPALVVRAPTATMLRVETLAATFEEVDFLASLGLWNDAMDVLKGYLEDSAAPAPLAYYELMRLCVHTDDAASLVAVRKRFVQVFGVDAPKFEQINAPLGLESYPDLARRIGDAWGTEEALDFIELTLFTAAPPGKAYSVQAGRDLLFLHDVAMTVLRESGAGADGHALAPWANAEDSEQARLAVQDTGDVAGGHRFGLDLDLSVEPGQMLEPLPDTDLSPLELAPRAPTARRPAPEPAPDLEPEPLSLVPTSAPAPLDIEDAFSVATASERMRRL